MDREVASRAMMKEMMKSANKEETEE